MGLGPGRPTSAGGAAASGVIIAQGGALARWSLHHQDGKPVDGSDFAGLGRPEVRGDKPLTAGNDHLITPEERPSVALARQ